MDTNWLISLVISAVIGAVAGVLVRGRSSGCIGNIIIGVIGAWLGNFIANQLLGYNISVTRALDVYLPGQIVPFAISLGGAIVFLLGWRMLFGKPE